MRSCDVGGDLMGCWLEVKRQWMVLIGIAVVSEQASTTIYIYHPLCLPAYLPFHPAENIPCSNSYPCLNL